MSPSASKSTNEARRTCVRTTTTRHPAPRICTKDHALLRRRNKIIEPENSTHAGANAPSALPNVTSLLSHLHLTSRPQRQHCHRFSTPYHATDDQKPTETGHCSSRASHHRHVQNVIPTGKTPSQSRIVNAQHLLTQSVALHHGGATSSQYRFKERLKEGQNTLFGQRSQPAGGVRDLTKSLPEPEAA